MNSASRTANRRGVTVAAAGTFLVAVAQASLVDGSQYRSPCRLPADSSGAALADLLDSEAGHAPRVRLLSVAGD
jgi:hypothetical protein